jgi:hypothetical protein
LRGAVLNYGLRFDTSVRSGQAHLLLSRLLRLAIRPVIPVIALMAITGPPLIVTAIFAMLLPVVIAAVLILKARLIILMPLHGWLIALPHFIRLIVGGVITFEALGSAMATAVHLTARLLPLLLAVGQYDAVVMLRVLQIILRQHRIARRLSIACQREILLGDMRRRATNLHFGPVGLKASRQGIISLSMVIIVAVTLVVIVIIISATAAAMLLSLPHGLPFSH